MAKTSIEKAFYRWTRDLHLYVVLLVSPFVIAFAASVFFLNHAKVATGAPPAMTSRSDGGCFAASVQRASSPGHG